MKSVLAVFAVLGLLTSAAVADETQAESTTPPPTETAPAEDCTKLEGEAKTACEAKAAEAQTEPTTTTEKAGKSMNKSESGNMESYDSDE